MTTLPDYSFDQVLDWCSNGEVSIIVAFEEFTKITAYRSSGEVTTFTETNKRAYRELRREIDPKMPLALFTITYSAGAMTVDLTHLKSYEFAITTKIETQPQLTAIHTWRFKAYTQHGKSAFCGADCILGSKEDLCHEDFRSSLDNRWRSMHDPLVNKI